MSATQDSNGRLALEFALDAGTSRTVMRINEQRQPLKVVRAFDLDAGAALVHIHNLSGGVLAGDRLSLDLTVGPRASVQLTSTGATRVYRSRPGAPPAEFSTRVRVCQDGLLEYLPDPLIPFAGCRYVQHTDVELEDGAGLFWWETIAPGREARGEVFSYDALELSFRLQAGGLLIATERSDLDPAVRPLCSAARLGPYRYFSSFYICRAGTDANTWRGLETSLRRNRSAALLACDNMGPQHTSGARNRSSRVEFEWSRDRLGTGRFLACSEAAAVRPRRRYPS